MALFSSLTGGPAHTAANAQRDLYGNVLGMGLPVIGAGQTASLGYLGEGREGALGQIGAGVDIGRGDIVGGIGQGRYDIAQGAGFGQGYLDQGVGAGREALAGASAAYAPLEQLAGRYRTGADMYSNALGLGGAGGVAAAQDAFHTGPGYNFAVDQGLEAINRRRNASGQLVGGNADRDAMTYGQGLANQEYNNWLSRLQGFQPLELAATSGAATGRAGIGRDLANLEAGYGRTSADLARSTGLSLAELAQRGGQSLSDLAMRGGLAGAGVETGYGTGASNVIQQADANRLGLLNSVTRPYADTYGQEAAAEMQASGNALNLGMNVLRTIGGSMWGGGPMGGGGGGGGGSLGSLFRSPISGSSGSMWP